MARRTALIVALLGGVVAASVALLGGLTAEVLGRLLFGWWTYLARTVPSITVAWDGVATAVVCLVLFTIGLHVFSRWLFAEVRRARGRSDGPPRPWRMRWTASLVAVIVLMFVAGMAAAGIVHQAGWLLAAKKPLTSPRLDLRYTSTSIFNLKEIAMAVVNYDSVREASPEEKTDGEGRNLQSWQTKILPYTAIIPGGQIHEELPWDDPRNSAYFRGVVLPYLNPEINGAIRDARGYALSHYAGNVHVWGRDRVLSAREASQGAANLIAAGEVAGGFLPWGDPTNLRDPARGINTTADGFGGPSGTGANVLLLDGSVRFLSRATDSKVLHRLSRPAEERTNQPHSLP